MNSWYKKVKFSKEIRLVYFKLTKFALFIYFESISYSLFTNSIWFKILFRVIWYVQVKQLLMCTRYKSSFPWLNIETKETFCMFEATIKLFCIYKVFFSVSTWRQRKEDFYMVCSTFNSSILLKSDFNAVLFVIKPRELLFKNIKITTVCNLKKGFTRKKYLTNNYFRLLFSGFIRMKVNTTLSLAGCLDVT